MGTPGTISSSIRIEMENTDTVPWIIGLIALAISLVIVIWVCAKKSSCSSANETPKNAIITANAMYNLEDLNNIHETFSMSNKNENNDDDSSSFIQLPKWNSSIPSWGSTLQGQLVKAENRYSWDTGYSVRLVFNYKLQVNIYLNRNILVKIEPPIKPGGESTVLVNNVVQESRIYNAVDTQRTVLTLTQINGSIYMSLQNENAKLGDTHNLGVLPQSEIQMHISLGGGNYKIPIKAEYAVTLVNKLEEA